MTRRLGPHQIDAAEATDGQVLAWNDTANRWEPAAAPTDAEGVRDVIGAALVAGAGVTVTVNDGADTITVAATFDAEAARDTIGSALVAGTGISITVNDAGDSITIAVSQPVVLLAHGGSVPGGTPVGALIFEKG